MLEKLRSNKKEVASTILMLIVVISSWAVVSHLQVVSELFLPTPSTVGEAFYSLQVEGYRGYSILQHIGRSLFRVFVAFLGAIFLGIPLGLGIALNVYIKGIFDPIIELYRPVPPIALIPLFIIWFGIGEVSKILLIFIAMFAVIVINTASGVRGVQQEKVWAAKSLGGDKWQIIRHVILPGAMPEILTGMRVGIGFGWTTLVAAEMIAATAGIGWMVLNARRYLRTDIIMAGVIAMGILGFLLDRSIRVIEGQIVPWKGQE